MQKTHRGDLLANVTSNAIIVHGCNAKGVMGKGIAKSIKDLYPAAYLKYKEHERKNGLVLGDIPTAKVNDNNLFVVNGITQQEYWVPGASKSNVYVNYDAIALVFENLRLWMKVNKIDLPIHYPAIGAGLAGGDWERINNIINAELYGHDHHLWIWG